MLLPRLLGSRRSQEPIPGNSEHKARDSLDDGFVLQYLFCEIGPDRLAFTPHAHQRALGAHVPVVSSPYVLP
ncbi:hypothetical protein AMELA_G00249540 [Ameiurus melas]|uniref:Uncharacterized protein n=1 Tax=Ameiurus melas TaxID=219545 RepID=A0A7J5ZTT1_AMEME|nr:hypothetical protein AMELA_G00249540 [Ameiurus melas]